MLDVVNYAAMLISKRLNESTAIKESDDELESQVDDTETSDETEDTAAINPDFEESITDTVYFCTKCNKHFIATKDTPEEEKICPVCNEKELIVNIGSAQEALNDSENQDVATEIQDTETSEDIPEDIPEDDISIDDEEFDDDEEIDDDEKFDDNDDDDINESIKRPIKSKKPVKKSIKKHTYFDNHTLEEGLCSLATKYLKLNPKTPVRIREGRVLKDGTLVLKGTVGKKRITVIGENFKQLSNKKKFVVEGKTNLFKNSKFKFLMVREGNTISIKKFGYGFILESANRVKKVTGIAISE